MSHGQGSAYLEMLSNGTIDDFFLSVSEEAQNLMNTIIFFDY
jgi:hypothetical protein